MKKSNKGNTSISPIGARIRQWRKHLGLTQIEFAQLLGLHVGMVRKYEIGANIPGGEVLIAIGKSGVSLNWLLLGEEPMCAGGGGDDEDEIYGKRIEALRGLLDGLEKNKREAVLDEIFSRVQEAKRVADLEGFVRELARKLG